MRQTGRVGMPRRDLQLRGCREWRDLDASSLRDEFSKSSINLIVDLSQYVLCGLDQDVVDARRMMEDQHGDPTLGVVVPYPLRSVS
jgi:hypothetical protein